MTLHLPKPYPDELLYSVLARYCRYLGLRSTCQASKHIFENEKHSVAVDMMKQLSTISVRSHHIWGLSSEEIAEQMTLYPFYMRYAAKDRAVEILKLLKGESARAITQMRTLIGLTGGRIHAAEYLRYCSLCSADDIKKYGETYWRRSHHMPSVYACPQHGVELVELYSPRFRVGMQRDYFDATAVINNDCTKLTRNIDKPSLVKATLIARRCRAMLEGPINRWPLENVKKQYREAMFERGYGKGLYQIDIKRLGRDILDYFKPSLLEIMNCGSNRSGYEKWVHRLANSSIPVTAIEHALVQVFIENGEVIPIHKRPSAEMGPWKCPNPYANHQELFPIADADVRLKRNIKGEIVYRASCKCGYHFHFKSVSDKDNKMPLVCKAKRYGNSWREEIDRLRKLGMSCKEICAQMGINESALYSLAKSSDKKRKKKIDMLSNKDIMKKRSVWTKIIKKVPNRSRNLARTKNPNLYEWLRRYDKSWLYKDPRPRYRGNGRCVDWKERDKIWSQQLREAGGRLVKLRQPIQIRVLTLLKEANLYIKYECLSTKKLPLCQKVINKFSESREAYQKRRLKYFVEQVKNVDSPITYTAFIRLVGWVYTCEGRLRNMVRDVLMTKLKGLVVGGDKNRYLVSQ